MKGLVFNAFLAMMEQEIGIANTQHCINHSGIPSKGIFSAVGNYPSTELVQLLTAYCELHQKNPGEVLFAFGEFMFSHFKKHYASMVDKFNSPFQMLLRLDDNIHPEVLKLYPDAKVPGFKASMLDDNSMKLIYTSERGLHVFADGLISGCFKHFNIPYQLKKTLVNENGSHVEYIITTENE